MFLILKPFPVALYFSGLEILTAVEKEAGRVLSDVYDDYVVKEWMRDKIDNIIKHLNNEKTRLEELLKVAAQSGEKKVW